MKEKGIEGGKSYWKTQEKTAKAISWKGYAFENVSLKHIDQIRSALARISHKLLQKLCMMFAQVCKITR